MSGSITGMQGMNDEKEKLAVDYASVNTSTRPPSALAIVIAVLSFLAGGFLSFIGLLLLAVGITEKWFNWCGLMILVMGIGFCLIGVDFKRHMPIE
jgi:hypothetical protein